MHMLQKSRDLNLSNISLWLHARVCELLLRAYFLSFAWHRIPQNLSQWSILPLVRVVFFRGDILQQQC